MGEAASAEEFWDGRYGGGERIWSGRPNEALAREVRGMAPGTALDLGCGEGGDAIWLAGQGWRVVGVDISRKALERAAAHAEDAGLTGQVEWRRHDLAADFPAGSYDLVSAHFLHSPVEMPREAILRSAAAAVAPGGVLLVVGHAGWPAGEADPDLDVHFPTPDEVHASLELPPGQWEVLVASEYEREFTDPEGRVRTRPDNTLKLRRAKAPTPATAPAPAPGRTSAR
ncbi:class I SAM-dependent methyltransferase [Actinacidiphila sp. bgisy144]|uniref:class I SAM-dependent methyltransferase n=1 Tax=Actinacidiphila sp. bgisy144 TaxID=3413791 RepID=UPI003EBBDDFE